MLGYCRTLGKVRLFYVITKKLLAFFSKTYQSSLTLKGGSTAFSKPFSPQGTGDVPTALLGAQTASLYGWRTIRGLRQQQSCGFLCGDEPAFTQGFAKGLLARCFFRNLPVLPFLIKRAALGNMKANFHCAHLHNLSPQGTRDVPTALSIVFTTPSVPLIGDRNGAQTASLYGWRTIRGLRQQQSCGFLCGDEPAFTQGFAKGLLAALRSHC